MWELHTWMFPKGIVCCCGVGNFRNKFLCPTCVRLPSLGIQRIKVEEEASITTVWTDRDVIFCLRLESPFNLDFAFLNLEISWRDSFNCLFFFSSLPVAASSDNLRREFCSFRTPIMSSFSWSVDIVCSVRVNDTPISQDNLRCVVARIDASTPPNELKVTLLEMSTTYWATTSQLWFLQVTCPNKIDPFLPFFSCR